MVQGSQKVGACGPGRGAPRPTDTNGVHNSAFQYVTIISIGRMRFLIPILLLAGNLIFAEEYALLAGGGRLRIDRHETSGGKVLLYIGGGSIEMDSVHIVG